MISNTPEYLKTEVEQKYGISIPLEDVITYLEMDNSLTPESLYLYVMSGYDQDESGDIVNIPRGFTVLDLANEGQFTIQNVSGNYIWLIKDTCKFPQWDNFPIPVFNKVKIKGVLYRVMYTGKSANLGQRLINSHLHGKIAGSTLRKSLAILFNFKFEPYMSGRTPKVRIKPEEENFISRWLYENCILLYKQYQNYGEMEERLIALLDPPLNIDMNPNIHNGNYASMLKCYRQTGGTGSNADGLSGIIASIFDYLFVGRVFKGTYLEKDKSSLWILLLLLLFIAWYALSPDFRFLVNEFALLVFQKKGT